MSEKKRIYDSSLTRVKPVFDFLKDENKLDIVKLLSIPTNGIGCFEYSRKIDFKLGKSFWGEDEKKLAPPVSLLSWIIQNLKVSPKEKNNHNSNETLQKRKKLFEGDTDTIREALELLKTKKSGKQWYILEGETQPDVFIETDDIIIVIEGKRTESGVTKDTTWMEGRHQMWRHIDCAWEIRGNKQVYGFFIVESSDVNLPEKWVEEIRETKSDDSIKSSLPHRELEEQNAIKKCFIGGTTWQKLVEEFNIPTDKLKDKV